MQNYYDAQTFCHNFRYVRKTNKLSQKKMAEVLHTSVGYVRRLERGEIPARLRIDILIHMHSYFGVPIDDLLSCSMEKTLL